MGSIRNEIMYFIKKHDYLVKDISKKLNITSQNLTNKLTRETITYRDVKKIADILGYDIIWKKRQK
ncbi:MAG: LLM class flavin-dependent oxidoreductase [Vallitalea sp.]|nr:LLM class flavin-dependent oxidoreductase [Vallitalea sp.]